MKIWFRVSLTPLRIVCLARTRTRPGWLGQAIRLFNIVHICQKLAKAVSPKSSAPSPFPPPQLWPPPPPPPQPAPPPSAMQRQGWPRMRNRLISHSAPPRFPSPLAFSGLFLLLSFFNDVMSIDWIDGLYASFFFIWSSASFCRSPVVMSVCAESLLPLHSATASSRLNSILSASTGSFGWLLQGKSCSLLVFFFLLGCLFEQNGMVLLTCSCCCVCWIRELNVWCCLWSFALQCDSLICDLLGPFCFGCCFAMSYIWKMRAAPPIGDWSCRVCLDY